MSGGGLWNSDNSLCDGYGRVQIEGLAGEREEGLCWVLLVFINVPQPQTSV